MGNDLISRAALMEAMRVHGNNIRGEMTYSPGVRLCMWDAEDAPAVNAELVRHGRWIQYDKTKCRCSECDVITLIAQYPRGGKKYCPNCGAKMDGGAQDDG